MTLLPLGEHVPKTDAKCFELYGFDILLDDALRPWLIEVNFSPSLGGDSTTDQTVKEGLIEDVIDTLDFRAPVVEEPSVVLEDASAGATSDMVVAAPPAPLLEKDAEYVKEYDRFLSGTPYTHRDDALKNGGVGNFDLIFPFNEETRDAATKYGDLIEPEVQQDRIVNAVKEKYGKFKDPRVGTSL